MAKIKLCDKCNAKISIIKMPNGRWLPFDFQSNKLHVCYNDLVTEKKAFSNDIDKLNSITCLLYVLKQLIDIQDHNSILSEKKLHNDILKEEIRKRIEEKKLKKLYEEQQRKEFEIKRKEEEKKTRVKIIYQSIVLIIIIIFILIYLFY